MHVCASIRGLPWQEYIISDPCLCCLASWLIHPLPLDRASLCCPASNSLAHYHSNTILPPQSPNYYHVPILTLTRRKPISLTLYPLWQIFIWAWPKRITIQLSDTIILTKNVMFVWVCVWVCPYLSSSCCGDIHLFTQWHFGDFPPFWNKELVPTW